MAQLLGLTVCAKWKGFRLQFQLWNMIGVHIVTAYSSSLAARLASSDYEKRYLFYWSNFIFSAINWKIDWRYYDCSLTNSIDTAQDFIEANLTWGREGLRPNFSVFRDHTVSCRTVWHTKFIVMISIMMKFWLAASMEKPIHQTLWKRGQWRRETRKNIERKLCHSWTGRGIDFLPGKWS